ncbi:hypothetical protein [Vibrio mangrovi]|uniref:Uncharacterized protein n=1 Tax=Vibrio mangrovi TaxID=474394 RepID=A0A1Y6IW78_9VIBR|nr:hypothetical protein [Vibrio mangrovi]MDW6004464.1 hypothetical protein [Vibrio mangrovi]SMS00752.1 hypothetical protein VIM7927_02021 [Vibrio mangrovi]
MKIFIVVFILSVCAGSVFAKGILSDAEIRQQIIRDSIRQYSGNCACPYNRASNGYKCGKRSAWSRAGGYSPICYASEISDGDVKEWRAAHSQQKSGGKQQNAIQDK